MIVNTNFDLRNIQKKPNQNIKRNSVKKFHVNSSEQEVQNVEVITSVPEFNPYIFLQEYVGDFEREELHKSTKEILNALHKIQIKILSDDLRQEDLERLKKIINSQVGVFKTQEVQELYNQVRMKAEIELAKYHSQQNYVH